MTITVAGTATSSANAQLLLLAVLLSAMADPDATVQAVASELIESALIPSADHGYVDCYASSLCSNLFPAVPSKRSYLAGNGSIVIAPKLIHHLVQGGSVLSGGAHMLVQLITACVCFTGYAYSKEISLSDLLLNSPMLLEWIARSFIAKGESIGALQDPSKRQLSSMMQDTPATARG